MYGCICATCTTNCENNKIIKKFPKEDRPYEKLELKGSSNLTNSELLAIIIKNGTKSKNCIEIAQNILSNNTNENISMLEYLDSISLQKLKSYEGIGRVKAIQIKALVELSKRFINDFNICKTKIKCPKDVYETLAYEYMCKKQEILKIVILNKQNEILLVHTVAIGNNDRIDIGIKECLAEPIKNMASAIILVHNHPSGSLNPSKKDIEFTDKIKEYSKIFSIELLDHIIIANNKYMSFKEKGYL